MNGQSKVRTGLVAAGLMLALGLPGWIALDRQQVVEHGRTVLVPLAPIDPRSPSVLARECVAYSAPLAASTRASAATSSKSP